MFSFLPAQVCLVLTASLIIANTIVLCLPLFVVSFFKLILPLKPWQKLCTQILIFIAESWISINNAIMWLFVRLDLQVEGLEHIKREGWYLVIANHQSWVDIPMLQRAVNHKIPFLKFFLKQELIKVPLLGMAWWALDFPFMKRYSKEFLAKHPEMKGKDLETTRKACEKFKTSPVSVMNFVEGTRFTPEKHQRQKSPYQYLLKPKSGGIAFVLSAMGQQFNSLLDVSIVYPQGIPTFADLLAGRVNSVKVVFKSREIPVEILAGDYQNDVEFRKQFHQWLAGIWQEKDDFLKQQYQ